MNLELFPHKTAQLCTRDSVSCGIRSGAVILERPGISMLTPYTSGDWDDTELEPTRVVWCLLGELGPIETGEHCLPDGFTPRRFVRRLKNFLPDVDEYLSAMEEDLKLGDLHITKTLLDAQMDPFSIEFEAFLLPSSLLF